MEHTYIVDFQDLEDILMSLFMALNPDDDIDFWAVPATIRGHEIYLEIENADEINHVIYENDAGTTRTVSHLWKMTPANLCELGEKILTFLFSVNKLVDKYPHDWKVNITFLHKTNDELAFVVGKKQ